LFKLKLYFRKLKLKKKQRSVSQKMNDVTANNYNFISNYFDKHLYKFDVLSTIGLALYFPIGSLLVLFRIVLILLLNTLFHFKPNLRNNFYFVHLTCLCLGIYTRVIDDESKSENDSNLKVLISNHISCLDFFSIKTVYNECNAAVPYVHSNRNLHNNQSAAGFFERFTCKAFHDSCLIQTENFTRNKSNHPLVFFPELMSTNGKYGLLKFDSKPFDLEVSSSNLVYKPICLSVRRPILPLSVNYMYSNNFTKIVFTLFAPITFYEISLLKSETKGSNETSEQFSERIRSLMSSKLKLNVVTEMNFNNFQLILRNYQEAEMAAANLPRRNNTQNSSGHSMSFEDISRLALQIKEILPEVSYEIIQSHIRMSPTLDIDTVLASILDSTQALTLSNSASTCVSQPSSVKKDFNKQNSFKNYEERKFELINEARKRYLAKNSS
jgi:hypothetical protein